MTDCPTDELLAKYLDDALSPTVSVPLTMHVDGCPVCQAKLDAITADGTVSDRLRALSSAVLRGPQPDATLDRGVVATTATDTQVFGSDGIPMVPRVHVPRPSVPGYEVEGEIGRGGMGVVFRATHKRLNRTVALKMVLAAGVADPRVTQRFLFEAEVLAKVHHPQVVQVYEVNMFTAPTGVVFPFLAMELLSGGTLNQWADGRPIPAAEAAGLVEGLARAVHAVHQQGIVHRDLKPANILKSADGVFKVSDFGLAKLTAESGANLTGTGMVVGTPAYMAPEQAGGDGPIGPPADVYSLGAMLFELLAGRPPFPGDDAMSVLLKVIRDDAPDVRSVRADVPRDLAAVVMKCLNKQPARRYPTADDLADDLQRFLNRRPTRARTLSAVERGWYWARRNPTVAGLLTALGVVLTAGFAVSFVMWQRAEGEADRARRESVRAGLLAERAGKKSGEAEEERRKAEASRADLTFDRAVNLCESGLTARGLSEFVTALELAERTGQGELARVTRVNIAAWERELYPAGRRLPLAAPGHPPGAADLVATSGDGKWVLAADRDRRVWVWEADTGRLAAVCPTVEPRTGPTDPDWLAWTLVDRPRLTGLAIDPDGRCVAATTNNGVLVLWSLDDGHTTWVRVPRNPPPAVPPAPPPAGLPGWLPVPTAAGEKALLWSVAFTGQGVWVGGDNGLAAEFDPAAGRLGRRLPVPPPVDPTTGRPLPVNPDQPGDPTSVQVVLAAPDPADPTLFTGDRAARLIEWDVRTQKRRAIHRFDGNQWVGSVAVSGDGRFVAGCATDSTARLWRRGNPYYEWKIPLGGAYGSRVGLSHDGSRLAVSDSDGRVTVYDTRARIPLGTSLRRPTGTIAFRPHSDELVMPDGDAVLLQPTPSPRHVPVPSSPPVLVPQGQVRCLDFHPRGDALLVGAGLPGVYDPATGRPLPSPGFAAEVRDEVTRLRYSEDGGLIAYACRHHFGVVDADWRRRCRVDARNGYPAPFPFRPTADRVCLDWNREVIDYATDTGLPVRGFPLRGRSRADQVVHGVIGTPGRAELRVVTTAGVEFYHPDTGDPVRPPVRAGGRVTAAVQSEDGRFLAVMLEGDVVELWEAAAGRRLSAVQVRHREAVTAVVLSPDGKVLLTGSRDRTTQFWDTATGRVLGPRRTHGWAVTTAAYSPTGDRVAVGTDHAMTAVWPTPPAPTADGVADLRARYPAADHQPEPGPTG